MSGTKTTEGMKILHVSFHLRGGGAERQLQILCAESVKAGIEVAVFCVDSAGESDLAEGVKVFKYSRTSKMDLGIFRAISSVLTTFEPTLMHVWLPPAVTVPALILGARARIPTLFAYRNVMRYRRALDLVEFAVAALFANRVVSNCPVTRSGLLYRMMYSVKKGAYVPNAVVPAPDNYQRRESDQNSVFEIIFVGRLVEQKNWHCLLKAVGGLPRDEKWILKICGDGPDRGDAMSMCRELEIESRVSFLGFRSDVIDVMRDADVLVLPSWHEGMPNVLLEAFSVGLGAVISDIPEHRIIVNSSEAARTFNPANSHELRDILIDLINDRDKLRELRRRGKAVIDKFLPERMFHRYLEIYSEMTRAT